MSLCTEDAAKERWCPFARYTVESRAWKRAINRWVGKSDMTLNPEPARCIASQCMAWRWQPLQADQPFMDAVKKRMDDAKDKHPTAVKYVRANLAEFGLPDKPFRGYCGLAGTP